MAYYYTQFIYLLPGTSSTLEMMIRFLCLASLLIIWQCLPLLMDVYSAAPAAILNGVAQVIVLSMNMIMNATSTICCSIKITLCGGYQLLCY